MSWFKTKWWTDFFLFTADSFYNRNPLNYILVTQAWSIAKNIEVKAVPVRQSQLLHLIIVHEEEEEKEI